MKSEIMKKILFVLCAVVMSISVVRAQEEIGEEASEEVSPDAVFAVVGKLDFGRETMFMWWTDEVWASLAYKDKTPDSVLAYTMINMLGKKYLLYSPISLSGSPFDLSGSAYVPSLAYGDCASVSAVPVHESFTKMLPGLIAFPMVDTEGKSVVCDSAEDVTLTVMYPGEEETVDYIWKLPLQYPSFVDHAYTWLNGRMNMDPTLLSDEELIFGYMRDLFRADIGTGVMVAPMPSELFDMFMMREADMSDDPLVQNLVKSIIDNYTFFMVMSIDMGENPGRLKELLKDAYAVNADGETVQRDLAAEKSFSESDMGDTEYVFMLFPSLGESGYSLNIFPPDSEEAITLQW